MKNTFRLHVLLLILYCTMQTSCKKFVEVGFPKDQIIKDDIFANDETVTSAILGVYSRMVTDGMFSGGYNSFSLISGLTSDELLNYYLFYEEFASNEILPNNSTMGYNLWAEPFNYIYTVNSILEGLPSAETITTATKTQLRGEALFIRSWCYFYLVNIYSDVPFYTTTDYRINKSAQRTSKSKIYELLISDLLAAMELLSDGYVTNERVRPNKSTAAALLARVYLYSADYVNAEATATVIINDDKYNLQNDLDSVFLANSNEAVFQLKPVNSGLNTNEGSLFILSGAPAFASLRPEIYNGFETGDQRRHHWIDSVDDGSDVYYYPYKYKVSSGSDQIEYSMVFRLAEQYLIRAEARAQQGKLIGPNSAQTDIAIIRSRAGLGNTLSVSKENLLDDILKERKCELFTEGGHRWFDLIRFGKADDVLGQVKGSAWQLKDALFPIPQDEINNNKNITQNSDY